MSVDAYTLRPIGRVESVLEDRHTAPRQGDEGAPDAWLLFDENVSQGLRDIALGDELLVLTWFDRARRDVLEVRPRNNPKNDLCGVFSTRSPDRPNPIGLHRVTVVSIGDLRIQVSNLEALNGTPIVDVKPVLGRIEER
jgi:tRNA-Thr(GGU) m(6)t(6)A37 methyltransferase TsaA